MATRTRKLGSGEERLEVGGETPGIGGETSRTSGETIARDLPLFDGSVTRMMGWPIEVWLRCQAGMLKVAQPAASGWIARRRDAATATLDTFEKLASCNDLQEVAALQRVWFEESMKRLDSDLHAFADQAVALSQEAMSATRDAAQTTSEALGRMPSFMPHGEEPVGQAA
jgi:Phasin protein